MIQKIKKNLYVILYIINLVIILALIFIPTIIGPAPLFVFLVLSMYIGASFGVTFLALNIYGVFRFKSKRVIFLLVSCTTAIWVAWGLFNVIKGIDLP